MVKTLKLSAIVLFSCFSCSSFAQDVHNLYPYAEGVLYDNNGHDLSGFAKSNGASVAFVGGKIDEFSGGRWGYIQVCNERVPSLKTIYGKERQVIRNYSESMNATVALMQSKEGQKGTWWTRQSNSVNGPLFYKKVEDGGNVGIPYMRYSEFFKDLETKKFTIAEHFDSTFNQRDYDQLLGNYILLGKGTVKDVNDYKAIIDFYNGFLSKFTNLADPLLETKSFVTFVTVGKSRYIAYFNIVNGKLAGYLEATDIQYEHDKDLIINTTFKKLTGTTVYVYGDDIFGFEKNLLAYRHVHRNIEMVRVKTDATQKFK